MKRNLDKDTELDLSENIYLDEFGDIKYVKYISRICQPQTKRFSYKGHTYRLIDDEGNIIPKDADGENLNEFNSHGNTVPSSLKNEKV